MFFFACVLSFLIFIFTISFLSSALSPYSCLSAFFFFSLFSAFAYFAFLCSYNSFRYLESYFSITACVLHLCLCFPNFFLCIRSSFSLCLTVFLFSCSSLSVSFFNLSFFFYLSLVLPLLVIPSALFVFPFNSFS